MAPFLLLIVNSVLYDPPLMGAFKMHGYQRLLREVYDPLLSV